MWHVYVLYSMSGGKTYVGYTADINRRLFEHNISETRGFTLRYRPWELIYTESKESKPEAIERERFFKSGKGRDLIKAIVKEYLDGSQVRYPPAAEKD